MWPALAIITRDLKKYIRSPALITVSLILPLIQLVVIGNAVGGRIMNVAVALADMDRGPESRGLRQKLIAVEANANTFRIKNETSVAGAMEATKQGKVSAAIVIPEDYSRRVAAGSNPQLGLVLDNTDPFVVTTMTQKMGEVLQSLNAPTSAGTRPPGAASLAVVEVYPYVEYIQYLLPGSITLAIFVCSLIGGGLIYIDDKARGFHEGYLVTPITKFQLVCGMLLSGTAKATIAGLIVTLVGSILAGIIERVTLNSLIVIVVLNALVSFSLISMISFLMVRVSDPVIPRATFGLLNTLLFFPSGAMYPIYGFPDWLKWIAKYDPFTYAVHGFRSVLLKTVSWEAIQGDLLFLGIFSTICFFSTVFLFPRHL